jgi:tRNA pseudouridine55 synthase
MIKLVVRGLPYRTWEEREAERKRRAQIASRQGVIGLMRPVKDPEILAKYPPKAPPSGWLIIDKPSGMTSNDVLTKIKRKFGKFKLGHTGTLDPLATGVLPIAVGQASKLMNYIPDTSKAYTFTVKWGEATDSDDSDGTITATSKVLPTQKQIKAALPSFIGTIMQTPPAFSAVKVSGKRAYKLARQGETPDLTPKEITIKSLKVVSFDARNLTTFKVECSTGTYVRAIARDMAQMLGTYGHIVALRRTKSGKFTEKDTIPLANFLEIEQIDDALLHFLPLTTVLDDIPALAINEVEARAIERGAPIPALPLIERLGIKVSPESHFQLYYEGKFYAMAIIGGAKIKPVKVFVGKFLNE